MARKWETRVLVEMSLALALGFVLAHWRVYKMPQGGSVTLAMVPIFYLSLRQGWKAGMLAGAALGLLKLTIDPYMIHWGQVLLDYPLPYMVLGLSGLFRKSPLVGVLVGAMARFGIHVWAGAVFWGAYAWEGWNVWPYSLVYNASYMIPETIIAMVVVGLLMGKGGQWGINPKALKR